MASPYKALFCCAGRLLSIPRAMVSSLPARSSGYLKAKTFPIFIRNMASANKYHDCNNNQYYDPCPLFHHLPPKQNAYYFCRDIIGYADVWMVQNCRQIKNPPERVFYLQETKSLFSLDVARLFAFRAINNVKANALIFFKTLVARIANDC